MPADGASDGPESATWAIGLLARSLGPRARLPRHLSREGADSPAAKACGPRRRDRARRPGEQGGSRPDSDSDHLPPRLATSAATRRGGAMRGGIGRRAANGILCRLYGP
jgi:hypothetical protein